MEKIERNAKIVVILTPDGKQIARAYKTVHTVITDGESSHTLDPRDVELTPEEAGVFFGEATVATAEMIRQESARADAAEANAANMAAELAQERARADALEAKVKSALAALG